MNVVPVKVFEAMEADDPYSYVVFGGKYYNNSSGQTSTNVRSRISNFDELTVENFALWDIDFTTNTTTEETGRCDSYYLKINSYDPRSGILSFHFDIDHTMRTATIYFICLGGIPR